MPAAKTMYGLPQRGARVSLHQPVTNNLSTFPRNQDNEKVSLYIFICFNFFTRAGYELASSDFFFEENGKVKSSFLGHLVERA